jgi:hypothetical protein
MRLVLGLVDPAQPVLFLGLLLGSSDCSWNARNSAEFDFCRCHVFLKRKLYKFWVIFLWVQIEEEEKEPACADACCWFASLL